MTANLPPLLLTRPRVQSEDFSRRLAARLHPMPEVVITPVIEVRPCPPAERLDGFRGVVMTSAQAARAVGARPELRGLPAYLVGDRTARAARDAGLLPVRTAATAEALIDSLQAAPVPGPLVYLRGDVVRTDLAERLRSSGIETVERLVYEQLPQPPDAVAIALLGRPGPMAVALFSPRSAEIFATWAAAVPLAAKLHVLALSPAVAAACQVPIAARIGIAAEPTSAAMVEFVASFYRDWPG